MNEVEDAVACLRTGGVVVFPTETVYGLGADARNAAAVQRVFAIKGRSADHPLIVHLPSADQVLDWAPGYQRRHVPSWTASGPGRLPWYCRPEATCRAWSPEARTA